MKRTVTFEGTDAAAVRIKAQPGCPETTVEYGEIAVSRSRAVTIFGVLFIIGSTFDLGILRYDRYRFLLQDVSEGWVNLRYAISWMHRLAELATGIGILWRVEVARKSAILIGVLTLVTIPWRHPVAAFEHAVRHHGLEVTFLDWLQSVEPHRAAELYVLSLRVASIVVSTFYAGFALCAVAFFAHPAIRQEFRGYR